MISNSPKVYKKWTYPENAEMPDMDLIDFSAICLITFEIHKKNNDRHPTSMRFKAPMHISFGELFYLCLNDYNEVNPSTPIEYIDRDGKYYAWQFYEKPKHWWQAKKYIDPSITVMENKIKTNSVIVPYRVEADLRTTVAVGQTPADIVKQGKEAVQNYLSEIKKGKGRTDFLFEAKVLVIGEGGTGKTTFARKIKNTKASMPDERDTTIGISVDKWFFETDYHRNEALENIKFYVNLWDFGGQKIYQGTHQIFFTEKSFYVLIADTREQKTDFSYWLNTVEQLGGEDSSVIIVLNKKFGHEQEFDETGYRNQFGKIIKEVITLDLKDDELKIMALQNKLKLHLINLPGIGDALPPSWVAIREDLLKEKENFISFEKFRTICSERSVADFSTIETLSRYFHRLGVFTHYIDDEVLLDRIYLNSNWLVKTVYEVLNHEIAKAKRGKLTETDVKTIWSNNELHYEVKKLSQLMNKFGLMYNIPNSNEYVVPSHLPTDMPYKVWEHANSGILLQFIYEFDKYMPKGIMSRLIVALNHHIVNHDLVWHRGVNISSNGANAEIIESYGGTNRFVIRIAGTNKIELLAIIRERFAEVIKPFNKLSFKQLVPCVCNECRNSNDPAFHDYNLLLKFRIRDIGSQCTKTGEIVSAEELLKITPHKAEVNALVIKAGEIARTVKIFLASSSELVEDRREFEIFINRENKRLNEQGIFLHLQLWEDHIDAMSQSRLQDEYNRVVSECDIFFSMFFSKVGKYTAEEFEKALKQFKAKGKPLIYTYFKDAPININEIKRDDINSKINFEESLKLLGHFPTIYKNTEDLKYQFKMQLDKILYDSTLK